MPKRSGCLISGYYGCGNAGDEAVLAGVQATFAAMGSNRPELAVLSQNPESTMALHGLPAVPRMNAGAVIAAIRRSRLLLSGGGSLLQDTTSLHSLLYYLLVARAAPVLGTPLMFYAQGIGPLHRPASRKLVSITANRAACITVRDPASAQLLKDLGVHRPVEITADPAFALQPAPECTLQMVRQLEGLNTDEPYIIVAMRPWKGAPASRFAPLLLALQARCSMKICLLPMQHPIDRIYAQEAALATGAAERFHVLQLPYPPAVLLRLLQGAQAVVAMRLHALILAAAAGVPPIAISYDHKVEALMKRLGCPDDILQFDPEFANGDSVVHRVEQALIHRPQRSEILHAATCEMRQGAAVNTERALAAMH